MGRCVACTQRCSFRQARISGLDVVEWVAAALPMMALLLSECLPAQWLAAPAELTKQANRQSKAECLHTRRYSYLLLAASCPMSSLIRIALVARSAASAVRRQGLVCVRYVFQLMFACHLVVEQKRKK